MTTVGVPLSGHHRRSGRDRCGRRLSWSAYVMNRLLSQSKNLSGFQPQYQACHFRRQLAWYFKLGAELLTDRGLHL
jgi:hypothetical protein